MRELDYTYAVANIRARESSLLTTQDIGQLAACKTVDEALDYLYSKGYGGTDGDRDMDADTLLREELAQSWVYIRTLAPDFSLFAPLLYPNDFHNLKAILKGTVTGRSYERLLLEPYTVEPEMLIRAVQERAFTSLPAFIASAAAQAFDLLTHSGDGQLCDAVLDRAAMETSLTVAAQVQSPLLQELCEAQVALANIKIALRCAAMRFTASGKAENFLDLSLAPCRTVSIGQLRRVALAGVDDVLEYASHTPYAQVAQAYSESAQAFEKEADRFIGTLLQKSRYTAFGIDPLITYLFAKKAEVTAVRMILSGIRAGLSAEAITERLRELYV